MAGLLAVNPPFLEPRRAEEVVAAAASVEAADVVADLVGIGEVDEEAGEEGLVGIVVVVEEEGVALEVVDLVEDKEIGKIFWFLLI